MKEIYKNLGFLGFPNYEVSNLGNVKSLNYRSTGKAQVLKPADSGKGYLFVNLYKNGKNKMFKVHRLVAMAFIPNPDNLPEINHKDENKQNNKVDNLEFCDGEYNINFGTGIERRAKKVSKPVKQFDLRGNFIQEFPSVMEAQRKFGYSQGNISSACSGKLKTAYGYRWSYN